MKTHTLRWNGGRTGKILTFTPAFEKMLPNVHPWASRFLIAAMLKELRATLDYDQGMRLERSLPPVPAIHGQELTYALRWVDTGHRMLDLSIEDHLQVLDRTAHALFTLNQTSPV